MAVDYEDKRFAEVESDKKAALNEVDVTYGNMISDSDKYYQDQMDAVEKYGEEQRKNLNEQTDFAIEKIEQQKEQTKKDYTKEQAGAYVDWQKASDPYGVNAEKVAASGLANSGYADSLQTQRYVAYQSRVAVARETYNKAVLEYDNMMKEAKQQNNAALAEIAFNTLQTKLELSLQGFQHKNSLIIEKAKAKTAVEDTYYSRYMDVVDQINTENVLKFQQEQFDWEKEQAAKTSGGGSGSSSGGSAAINKGYSNGSVSTADIKAMQKALGVTADGKWGAKSTSAAGGLTAEEAWAAYQNGKLAGKFEIEADEGSVLDLGYGPISASKLAQLVASGEVIEYVENGVKKFRKNDKFRKNEKFTDIISAKNIFPFSK